MTSPRNAISRNGVRYYQTELGEMMSVTSIIRRGMATPPALDRWKQKRLAQFVVEAVADGHDNDTAIEIAISRQYESGPEALEGTRVHDALDVYAKTGELPDDARMAGYVRQWIKLSDDHDISVQASEVTLVNTTHRYTGTIDFAALIGHDASRPPMRPQDMHVGDYKTGKVHDAAVLQLALLSRCDAFLLDDQRVVSIPEERRLSGMFGLIVKLGPRSSHLYKADLRAGWKIAKVLFDVIKWQDETGKLAISDALLGKSALVALRSANDRRVEILERARTLDPTIARQAAAAWPGALPKLSEASTEWTDDLLDIADELIANAERGGLA
jgi:hypothetical protein